MAELYIRVVDKVGLDVYLDAQCTKAGDVIAVQRDGAEWGSAERTSADHRILRLVGMSLSEASAFLAPERAADPTQPSKTLQRRAFRIDLRQLAPDPTLGAWLTDARRRAPILIITDPTTTNLVRAATQQKPPIPDPRVIGPVRTVIG